MRDASEWNQLGPLRLELNDDPDVVRRYLADLHDVQGLLDPNDESATGRSAAATN